MSDHLNQITLNGERHPVAPETTVAALLESLGLAHAACAVEVNRQVVPKRQHGAHRLAGGDIVEIVTLVGGG